MLKHALILTFLGTVSAADPLTKISGHYTVVDMRRAAGVASPDIAFPDDGIGKSVSISKDRFAADGLGCDAWETQKLGDATTLTDDPLLADAFPVDPDTGERPAPVAFRLLCEGEYFATFAQTDPRILVMTLANEAVNAVMEMPLSPENYRRLEEKLAEMKFLFAEPDGQPDADADEAIRRYYAYRLQRGYMPLPLRPARSAALLAGMGVID